MMASALASFGVPMLLGVGHKLTSVTHCCRQHWPRPFVYRFSDGLGVARSRRKTIATFAMMFP